MKIGIYQLDGKIPNLALMKVVGYYESKNYEVEIYKGDLFKNEYDIIYMSKIFSFTPMPEIPDNALIGGTGIDYYNKLPVEIENSIPSYSLFDCNYHIGFSQKGCRFACKFCCVPKKEGKPYNYNSIDEILINPKGENKLMLLDNDFFGGDNWEVNLNRIIELKLKVCFVQGLNIRIITDKQAELLANCNFYNSKFKLKYLTFAWDRYKDGKIIMEGIKRCNKAKIKSEQMQFFILIGFDTTPAEDMERVMTLKDLGCKPYIMPYNKFDKYQKNFSRWVNHRAIFNSVKWEDYRNFNLKSFLNDKNQLSI